jgi:hypothetical protein
MKLSDFRFARWQNRRGIEWKMYYAFWAALVAVAAPYPKYPALHVSACLAGLVLIAAVVEQAIAMVAVQADSGLVVLPTPVTNGNHALMADLAARHHLPAVYPWRFYATSGGLASYAPDNLDLYRRAASYVNRVLRDEKPADVARFAANVKTFFLVMKKTRKTENPDCSRPNPSLPHPPRAGAGGRVPANRFDHRGE